MITGILYILQPQLVVGERVKIYTVFIESWIGLGGKECSLLSTCQLGIIIRYDSSFSNERWQVRQVER